MIKKEQEWLKRELRRISYKWPARKEALKAARVSRGKYICAICLEDSIDALYGPKEINLDHIDPVIDPLDGFIDWNNYIDRLFCPEDNWQVLCKHHHDVKTRIENEVRKQIAKEKNEGVYDDL